MDQQLTTEPLLIERSGKRLSLTLNRPGSLNALAPELVEKLIETLSGAQDVSLCVIKGMGKNFCAGFDLSDIENASDGDLLFRFLRIETLLQMIHHAAFPVVACAQGHVIGAGADLFAASWHRIAAPSAQFKMPGWNFELALGTRRLTRLVGSDAARDLLIDTRSADAAQAREMGLVSEIVDPDEWEDSLAVLVKRCCALPKDGREHMLALTTCDTRDADLAAIVHSAGRPGLKERILAYQKQVADTRREKRRKVREG
ncbi:MAG: enoyl-CoA hydratase/isomerase family protein [Stappiaceae bacterium]